MKGTQSALRLNELLDGPFILSFKPQQGFLGFSSAGHMAVGGRW